MQYGYRQIRSDITTLHYINPPLFRFSFLAPSGLAYRRVMVVGPLGIPEHRGQTFKWLIDWRAGDPKNAAQADSTCSSRLLVMVEVEVSLHFGGHLGALLAGGVPGPGALGGPEFRVGLTSIH